MTKTMIQLPRKIWFLWLQGFDQMPELVSKCYRSWCKHHPDWEVIFLDENNVTQFIDVKSIIEDRPSIIHRVSQSEIIRINLLRKYGGVWVDATCFCQQALDDWLFPYLESGFFAFHRPGIDRMLSSWFLAALPGNDLVEIYSETVNEFWPNNPKVKMWVDRPLVYQFIKKSKLHGYLKKRPTLWYHPIFIKVLKVYPYFWFFYLFEKLYHQNKVFQTIWDQTPKFSADIPHKIQHFGIFAPLDEAIKKDIDQAVDPLYKLTFKFDQEKLKAGSTLHYLLSKAPSAVDQN